ncbi:MAG: GWxTD domain-containing protein [Thermoanaerobaculia bacterium]|nr:GWxTD domain-containing protein [Thermoanaerobaculia bacterium]
MSRPLHCLSTRGVVCLSLLVFVAGVAGAARKREPLDLVNVHLSPTYSQWMVGAAGEMATEDEIQQFLALTEDAAAERFVEQFWKTRQDDAPAGEKTSVRAMVGLAENPMRDLYEERSLEADKRFSEAGYLGRRTARGTIYVLFGEPEESDYEVNPQPGGEPIIAWHYDRKHRGLDGRKAERLYRFIRHRDLTVTYRPSIGRRPGDRSRF